MRTINNVKVKLNRVLCHLGLPRDFRLEPPTLFQPNSIGDLSTEFHFSFPLERLIAISTGNIVKLKAVFQVI
jgi:hypothetical protein